MGTSGNFGKAARRTAAGGEDASNRNGRIGVVRSRARLPAGRRTKWVVLGFWVVVVVVVAAVAGPLSAKRQIRRLVL
jgi:hypothetical protein